jgi:hypothetical protein
MAGNDTKQLQLQISASAELLIRNLKTADNAVADFQRGTDARLSSIDSKFEKLGALKGKLSGLDSKIGVGDIVGAATGVTLVALAQRGLEYASSLGEVSQQLGVTTRDYQVYSYAASQAGIEQETMDKGLAKLTLTLGKARLGAEGPTKALNALGISVADLKDKTAGDVIPLLADGLGKIKDPAKRAALEVELFGKAGQKLDTLLSGGRGQIDELARAAADLGLVLSDEQIANADATADKLSEVKQVLEANVAKVVADNATSILSLASALGSLTVGIVNFLNSNPETALAIVGALAGGRVGGLPGAAAGAIAGYAGGRKIAEGRDDANLDLKFRRRAYAGALRENVAARRLKNGETPEGTTSYLGGLIGVRQGKSTRSGATLSSAEAEVARQRALLTKAETAARAKKPTPVAVVDADVPQLYAPAGKKPKAAPKGKSAEQLQREADAAAKKDRQDQRRANDLVSRATIDLAGSRADAAGDPDERLKIEQERIDLAKQGRDRDLEEQALDNRYIAANLDRLKSINAQAADIDKQLLAQRRNQEIDENTYESRRAKQDDEIALAEIAGKLTLIAKDRRAIEQRILALRQQEEREALERVATDKNNRYSPAERQQARDQLDRLPDRQAAERNALAQDQKGPVGQYRDGLVRAAGDMNEALQGVAANGLQSIEDGLVGVLDGTESVASAFKKMASSIVSDLIRIIIQKAILSSLGGSFFGIPLADGGPVLKRAGGGPIYGAGGPRDDRIPAMLSNGEYVINAAAYAEHPELVQAINGGRLARFATGGPVGRSSLPAALAPRLPSLAGTGASASRVQVDANVKVEPSPMFIATVQQTTIQTVGAAAEPIMAGAQDRTIRKLQRADLPGGFQ